MIGSGVAEQFIIWCQEAKEMGYKEEPRAEHQWLRSITLATQEADIRRIVV
jgi:hypothetical protein